MKKRAWSRKAKVRNPKRTVSSVKHGIVSVMVWTSRAPSGPGSVTLIADGTSDRSRRVISEVFGVMVFHCADIIKWCEADGAVPHCIHE